MASSFTLRKIADVERVLCASPAYLEKRGAPQTPEGIDSARLPAAALSWLAAVPLEPRLRGDTVSAPIAGPVDADDGDVLTQWALGGLGIVLKPLYEVAAYLADGRLVRVMPEARPQPVTLGALYPTRRLLPPRTRAFIDLAVEELRGYVAGELTRLGGGGGAVGARRAPPLSTPPKRAFSRLYEVVYVHMWSGACVSPDAQAATPRGTPCPQATRKQP